MGRDLKIRMQLAGKGKGGWFQILLYLILFPCETEVMTSPHTLPVQGHNLSVISDKNLLPVADSLVALVSVPQPSGEVTPGGSLCRATVVVPRFLHSANAC